MNSRLAVIGVAVLLTAGCAGGVGGTAPSTSPAPGLAVEVVTDKLTHGWEIGFLPGGQVLVSQRPGRLTLLSGSKPGATATEVSADFADVLVRGEGGLMGLVVHPDFATSRKFTTCQTHQQGDRAVDVRLVTWTLAADGRSAARNPEPLLTGLPVTASGRHSGCRLQLAPDGALLVGTGDAAQPAAAQDRQGLGGKVLRIDLNTGAPAPGNPFAGSGNARERLIYSFGHRNVQGLAVRPGGDQVFAAEHGPARDDEVNLVKAGANYGWDPSQGGTVTSYDESVPMTDTERFPDAVPSVWSSGGSTVAVCAADFLSGADWGELDGVLAVTTLKGSKLLLLSLDEAGAVKSVAAPKELDDTHGRLRAARRGPDGALYVTTSNGTGDKLLRITRR
ncbi:PQQ-dependent sugar dehydrogenase [Crossiella sp. SN42]|uniref:PQQ-dependent sugar dehydrogenase n=1 Tax=Crossiella sp. SN42 TaxID=2944808 RepID=UPI00207D5F82|nr:PQQ-dependent sugar dehydrogenase [Crossiella sp. SN42]MCO1577130.1 PQQ-dependent sugar dehydrogenase [Crossiella sp. SN42]